jgi:phosphonate transport system substrate-binding protein
MGKRRFMLTILLAAVVGQVFGQTEHAADAKPLRIGYLSSLFMDITPGDARAAIRVWGDQLIAKQGLNYAIQVTTFTNMPSQIEALRAGTIDVVTMSTQDFLKVRERIDASPWCLTVLEDKQSMEYELIVHRDSQVREVADLKGKNLLIAVNDEGLIPQTWLNVMLLRASLPEMERFFSAAKVVGKPSRAVLPVFFKQVDVCLIRKDAFRLMIELNPQLGQHLRVVVASPPYLNNIYCLRNGLPASERVELTRGMLSMNTTMEGEQILKLFRTDRLILFEPGLLEPVEQLFAEYRRLSGHDPKAQRPEGDQ